MDPAASVTPKPLSTYTPQTDPSKFIRTYAKDVAAISGVPQSQGVQASTPAPAPEPTTVQSEGVTMPTYDTSPVNRSEPASPTDFPQEEVDLKASDSDGIFAPLTTFTTPPPAATVPVAPPPVSVDAERESVLARLRAKMASQKPPAPVPAPLPPPPPPVEEPAIRTAAPDFSTTQEPVLPMPQVSKIPVSIPVAPAPIETSSPIHTYSSDFADHIDTEKSNTFSVLAAQSDAGQTPTHKSHRSALVPLIAGVAMLLIGGGAILGAYLFTKPGATNTTTANVPSLVQFDESVEVKGSGDQLMQAVAAVGKGGVVSGNVVVTYVTLATTTGSGIPQPGGVLIKQMNISAPDILLRNLDETSTVGVVQAGSETKPFMVLKVNSYERTFAGMLAWEPTMASDLSTLFPAYANAPQTSTTTASTTARVLAPGPTTFTDAVVANYDVRILRDAYGRSILLYGYRGKNLLIIARDQAAFTSLVSRLTAAGD